MARNSQFIVEIGHGLALMVGTPTISSWDSKSRPKNAKQGTFGYNLQTKSLEYWNGSEWYRAPLTEA